jgi:hypothetical protein
MSNLVRRLLIVTAAAGAVAVSAPAVQAATVAEPSLRPVNTTVQAQGIIMRDGGVCDPIRHMGC